MTAPLPANEEQRLAALRAYGVLDTQAEHVFDDIAILASQICESPISIISLVDQGRQWFKAHVGLDVSETPRDTAFCAHAILDSAHVLVVPDTTKDLRFADNPLVTGQPFIRFYAGAPLLSPEGHALGTLCVIDRVPRELRTEQEQALQALSRVVVALFEDRRRGPRPSLRTRSNSHGGHGSSRTPAGLESRTGAPPEPQGMPLAARTGDLRAPRLLLYSHDGLGLGHTSRNLAIARAITKQASDACVLLATSVDEIDHYEVPPNVEVLKLPGIQKVANDLYASRRLPISTDEIRELRSALLLAAVRSFEPSVLLVDKHPFGAGGELHAALEELRSAGGVPVLGLRDILDDPATVVADWSANRFYERVLSYYDQVLLYGDPTVFPATSEYAFPPLVAMRTEYCGYVVNVPEVAAQDTLRTLLYPYNHDPSRALVVATTGAGEDGRSLLETFLRAAVDAPWQGVAIAGARLPADSLRELSLLADRARVPLHRFLPNLAGAFSLVDALVCMGGYNTLAEALSSALPTVCVPRVGLRREQLLRASAFQRLGISSTLLPDELDPETLSERIARALASERSQLRQRIGAALRFDGAARAARRLLAAAARGQRL